MKEIKVYTTAYCGFCHQAKNLLNRLNLPFEEIGLDRNPDLRRRLSEENNGYRTVPMIFIDDKFIGGYTELTKLHKEGKL
ncbi:MAG: glutaredoxin domain-containing protein [Oligoflexus sp.]